MLAGVGRTDSVVAYGRVRRGVEFSSIRRSTSSNGSLLLAGAPFLESDVRCSLINKGSKKI